MAFSTSNVRVQNLGGGRRLYEGNWTGAQGDATGTQDFWGGRVCLSVWHTNDSAGDFEVVPTYSAASSTDGLVTVSVYNKTDVTSGIFTVITAS